MEGHKQSSGGRRQGSGMSRKGSGRSRKGKEVVKERQWDDASRIGSGRRWTAKERERLCTAGPQGKAVKSIQNTCKGSDRRRPVHGRTTSGGQWTGSGDRRPLCHRRCIRGDSLIRALRQATFGCFSKQMQRLCKVLKWRQYFRKENNTRWPCQKEQNNNCMFLQE